MFRKPPKWFLYYAVAVALLVYWPHLAGQAGYSGPIVAVVVEERSEATSLTPDQVAALRGPAADEYARAGGHWFFVVDKDATPPEGSSLLPAVEASVRAALATGLPLPLMVIHSKAGELLYVGPVTSTADLVATMKRFGGDGHE